MLRRNEDDIKIPINLIKYIARIIDKNNAIAIKKNTTKTYARACVCV